MDIGTFKQNWFLNQDLVKENQGGVSQQNARIDNEQ